MSEILLRIVEGAGVALYRHDASSGAELLPSRRDLFDYEGGYAWGYGGTGPLNLSHAIAGRIFLNDIKDANELSRRARIILDKVIIQLDGDTEHNISLASIKELFCD
ncbi:hypothetical protein ABQZ99_021115 (plasmid) [Xanthomonas hortorum pv. vitians]|uniref:Uncharacterized protein n=2 Tax=Xanthomonas hortorum TaxID=56454 RepID=A0A6V7FN60_9XANT|nr:MULTISPECIES: hypothetical protein [Xanthomonas]APP87381.1 hypothetical protein BI317_25290 [Xanthomonas hortorum pv. gardneri]ASW48718.1 hypothetical protein XJ27_22055 [Xanthomonas hortorum]MBF9172807.1 hypothetical protein [Xanthomonas campestris pv. campestris]MCC8496342.1 hypothetical protein [Xanthomonas hortorum pv. gardneri]MCE4282808.1 hypothetical protein [Xanthomonas hortorum pv. vitians]